MWSRPSHVADKRCGRCLALQFRCRTKKKKKSSFDYTIVRICRLAVLAAARASPPLFFAVPLHRAPRQLRDEINRPRTRIGTRRIRWPFLAKHRLPTALPERFAAGCAGPGANMSSTAEEDYFAVTCYY